MVQFIDLHDLYLSIAGSIDEANRLLEKSEEDAEFSYAITELDFSVTFNEMSIEEGKVKISLATENYQATEARNLKFKVRFVPRTTAQKVREEEPPKPEAIVPDLLNMKLDDAKAKIKTEKLELGNVNYDPQRRPAGYIISQDPAPLTRARYDSKVDFVVAGEAPKPAKKKSPKKTKNES